MTNIHLTKSIISLDLLLEISQMNFIVKHIVELAMVDANKNIIFH